jgi:hypothetical protein
MIEVNILLSNTKGHKMAVQYSSEIMEVSKG